MSNNHASTPTHSFLLVSCGIKGVKVLIDLFQVVMFHVVNEQGFQTLKHLDLQQSGRCQKKITWKSS